MCRDKVSKQGRNSHATHLLRIAKDMQATELDIKFPQLQCHGSRGNCEKSGLRLSTYACRPCAGQWKGQHAITPMTHDPATAPL